MYDVVVSVMARNNGEAIEEWRAGEWRAAYWCNQIVHIRGFSSAKDAWDFLHWGAFYSMLTPEGVDTPSGDGISESFLALHHGIYLKEFGLWTDWNLFESMCNVVLESEKSG